jgi:acyl-CoA hydrolase
VEEEQAMLNQNAALRPKRARAAAETRKGKRVSASETELVEVVLPNDANVLGNVLGGRVMHLIDIAGAIAAHRHANSLVVTASVDYIDFRNPIKVGELIILKSRVNRVFRTSVEVGVDVYSENVLTGKRVHTSSAFVTFVAIDQAGHPTPIRPLILRTAAERRRFREAGFRRRIRLAHRTGRGLRAEAARVERGRKA